MYSRIINGQEYTFGVSGKLIRNVLVMYDRETNSFWSQLLGEAVEGPLTGTRLEYLPSVMTTWEAWRAMHPDTIALEKGFFGPRDPYAGYYLSEDAGVIGSTYFDDRLGTKEFVIGVEHLGDAVAYPFSVLNDQPAINHTVGGLPVLVVFERSSGTGVVWERTLPDGQVLEFVSQRGTVLRDLQTGTLWNGLTGQAVEGSLAGQTLVPVKSTQSFWFGWVDFHPDTRLYGFED